MPYAPLTGFPGSQRSNAVRSVAWGFRLRPQLYFRQKKTVIPNFVELLIDRRILIRYDIFRFGRIDADCSNPHGKRALSVGRPFSYLQTIPVNFVKVQPLISSNLALENFKG